MRELTQTITYAHFGCVSDRALHTYERTRTSGYMYPTHRPRLRMVKYKFIKTTFIKKIFSSKSTFIKNHFHQKTLSSKTTFIKKPLSSKNQFHQKPLSSKSTFIKNHFHQKPLSSKTTFIRNHFPPEQKQYRPCLCEGVAGRRPATPSHKHGLCPLLDP